MTEMMISKVMALLGFVRDSLYLRIEPQKLYVRNMRTDLTFNEPAVMVISGAGDRKDIRAIGHTVAKAALEADTTTLWPLDDGIRENEEAARALLDYAVRGVSGHTFVQPVFYVHIARETQPAEDEVNALKQICRDIGAGEVVMLDHKDMLGVTPEQAVAQHTPAAT
ncbi:MAG: rod shape-determining protein [Micavibrio sp.]|nr:rod shape-determining protein [Micavibrio sp.]